MLVRAGVVEVDACHSALKVVQRIHSDYLVCMEVVSPFQPERRVPVNTTHLKSLPSCVCLQRRTVDELDAEADAMGAAAGAGVVFFNDSLWSSIIPALSRSCVPQRVPSGFCGREVHSSELRMPHRGLCIASEWGTGQLSPIKS